MRLLVTGDIIETKHFLPIVTHASAALGAARVILTHEHLGERIFPMLKEAYEPLGVVVEHWTPTEYHPQPFDVAHAALVVNTGKPHYVDVQALVNRCFFNGLNVFYLPLEGVETNKGKQILLFSRRPFYSSKFTRN